MFWKMTVFFVAVLLTAHTVQSETIVVVDCSGSMSGNNMTTAKQECEDLAKTVLVDETNPFVLIPFADVASSTVVCVDRPAAIRAIRDLKVSGGTNIASGLNAASDRIENLQGQTALVILISDGADASQARDKAETRLGTLLQTRDQNGDPTRMIVKRWGASTNAMVKRLQKFSANVIDAASSTIKPLVWKADVSVLSSERDPRNELHLLDLQIQFSANVFSQNQVVEAICNESQLAQKKVKLEGAKKKRLQVAIPILESDESSKKHSINIDFVVGGKKFESVRKEVALPNHQPIATLSVRKIGGKFEKWEDPDSGKLAGYIDVELRVEPSDPKTIGMPVRFEIKGSNDLLLTSSDPPDAKVGEKFVHRIPFEQATNSNKQSISIESFDISRKPESSLGLKQVAIAGLPLPKPTKTPVEITIERVESPVWVDLQKKRVQTVVHCSLFVDGPIPGKTTRLICQGVAKISPSEFHRGRQSLSLFVETTSSEGKGKTLPLFFSVEAEANSAIELELKNDSIDVKVPAPAPVQLILVDETGCQINTLRARGDDFANITIRPLLAGPLTEAAFKNAGPLELRIGNQSISQDLGANTISIPFSGSRRFLFEQTESVALQASLPKVDIVADQSLDVKMSRSSLLSVLVGRYSLYVAAVVVVTLLLVAMVLIFKKPPKPDFSVLANTQA